MSIIKIPSRNLAAENGLVADDIAEASAVQPADMTSKLNPDVTCGLGDVKSSCLYYL